MLNTEISNSVVDYEPREKNVYLASLKFDARAKWGQQSHE